MSPAARRTCDSARCTAARVAPWRLSTSPARPRSSPARPAASAPRPRGAPGAGVRVAVGARRVERLETAIRARARRHRPGELRALRRRRRSSARRRARHPRQQRRARARARPVLGVDRGGRGADARDERPRADADDAPLPAAHPRRRPHRQHRLDRRPAGVRERGVVLRRQGRGARFSHALREDLLGRPIRVTTVDPGLAETEFSLVRFKGDEEKAAAVYQGVEPLTAEDIADCVLFALTRPLHVNVDEIVVKALTQSTGGRILRTSSAALTILEGSTFCICDERGDIRERDGRVLRARTRAFSPASG